MSLLDVPLPIWLHIQSHLHWQERVAHCSHLSRRLPARCVWTPYDHVRLTDAMWEALLDDSRSAAGRLSSAASLDIGCHIDDVQLLQSLLEGVPSPFRARLEHLSALDPFTSLHTLLCSDRILQCIFDCGIHLPQLHSLCLWPLQPSRGLVSPLLYAHRRRLPLLRRLKLHRFSLHVDDHRLLLGLASLELLDISRCSWSARDIAPTVLSLPADLTHLLLDAGPAVTVPLMDGLLDTVISSNMCGLTSLQLRASLLTTSLSLLSALHSLVSLDLASSVLPDPSYLGSFVSASFRPLLPSLLHFDGSECEYEVRHHRQSVSSYVAFIEAHRQLRSFGCLLNQQMAVARLDLTTLSVLSEMRTLELPCAHHIRNYDNDSNDDDDEDDDGCGAASSLWLTIPEPLRFLRALSLRCSSITDSSLLDVVCACPALTHLLLLDSKELTTASLLVLARYCPQLAVLELSGPNVKFAQGAWREAAATQPLLAHLIPSYTAFAPSTSTLPASASATTASLPAENRVTFPALYNVTLECPYTSQLDSAGLSTLVAMLQPSSLHTLTIQLPAEDSAAFYLLHLAPLRHLRCLALVPSWNSCGLGRQRSSGVKQLLERCTEVRRLDRQQWERCVASQWDKDRLDMRPEGVDGDDSVWWQIGVGSEHVNDLQRVFTQARGENVDGREMFFQGLQAMCA